MLLGDDDKQAIREAPTSPAVYCVATVLPFLGYTKAVAAVHLYASAVGSSCELEAGGMIASTPLLCIDEPDIGIG